MYVNEWTLDYGDAGRSAVRELLRRGHEVGLVPDAGPIDFV
jgi:1,4-dihydroxy-6-naphthoate synthase